MNLLESQKVMMTILILAGILPLKFDTKYQIVKSLKIYVFFSITTYFIIQIFFTLTNVSATASITEKSEVTKMVYIVELVFLQTGFFILFCNGILNRKKQVNFFNKFLELELKMDQLGHNKQKAFRKFKIISVGIIVGLVTYIIIIGKCLGCKLYIFNYFFLL